MNSLEEEHKWIEVLGGRLHLIYRDVKCLDCIVEFSKKRHLEGEKFFALLNYLYRIIYDRVYLEVYKVLDLRKDVLSLKNFYKKTGDKKSWIEVEDHCVFSRIKAKRDDQLAHDNRELALDHSKATTHYEDNKLQLSELMEFLEFVKRGFEQSIASKGNPIFLYALGEEREVKELKDLLLIAFSENGKTSS